MERKRRMKTTDYQAGYDVDVDCIRAVWRRIQVALIVLFLVAAFQWQFIQLLEESKEFVMAKRMERLERLERVRSNLGNRKVPSSNIRKVSSKVHASKFRDEEVPKLAFAAPLESSWNPMSDVTVLREQIWNHNGSANAYLPDCMTDESLWLYEKHASLRRVTRFGARRSKTLADKMELSSTTLNIEDAIHFAKLMSEGNSLENIRNDFVKSFPRFRVAHGLVNELEAMSPFVPPEVDWQFWEYDVVPKRSVVVSDAGMGLGLVPPRDLWKAWLREHGFTSQFKFRARQGFPFESIPSCSSKKGNGGSSPSLIERSNHGKRKLLLVVSLRIEELKHVLVMLLMQPICRANVFTKHRNDVVLLLYFPMLRKEETNGNRAVDIAYELGLGECFAAIKFAHAGIYSRQHLQDDWISTNLMFFKLMIAPSFEHFRSEFKFMYWMSPSLVPIRPFWLETLYESIETVDSNFDIMFAGSQSSSLRTFTIIDSHGLYPLHSECWKTFLTYMIMANRGGDWAFEIIISSSFDDIARQKRFLINDWVGNLSQNITGYSIGSAPEAESNTMFVRFDI